jgi:anti-sigma regulatory factor (Ser/Thr protein kinase)
VVRHDRNVDEPGVSALEFAALPGAVPCARLHTRAVLAEWELAAVTDIVELVVSELVTNAVTASTRSSGRPSYQRRAGLPAVALRLSANHERILIEVWDSVPTPPIPKEPGPDEDSGRRLLLVEALCERWGYYVQDSQRGKVVWAEIRHEIGGMRYA